jgi:outer membrane protein assembly factor BamB
MTDISPTNSLSSIWPRSGGNRGNQSRISVPGPAKGDVFKKVRLPGLDRDEKGNRHGTAGGVVAADGSLRVVSNGVLYALSLKGKILWQQSLLKYSIAENSIESDSELLASFRHSLPTIINDLNTLIVLNKKAVILDKGGQLVSQISIPTWVYQSPNLTLDEEPVFTADSGGVFIWNNSGLVNFPVKGLDIKRAAVYDDGTLGISAYALDGYCRVHVDSSIVWKTTLKDADLIPALNDAQYAAVGSVNDEYSVIFSPEGQIVGQYPEAAIFAVCVNDDWIASSKEHVARLDQKGQVLWQYDRSDVFDVFSGFQPIVCGDDRVYFVDDNRLIMLEGDGRKIWELRLGTTSPYVFPISAGIFGAMVDETLWFIH